MFNIPHEIPVDFCSSEGEWKEIRSPNDGEVLTSVQYATEGDALFILSKLLSDQKEVKKLGQTKRSAILKSASQIMAQDLERLAWIIASEGGKPLKDARVEVSRAINTLALCSEETLKLESKIDIPMNLTPAGSGHKAYTYREPIGPVLAISAFNHPLNLLAHQVGCAIASGCAVILKPAPATPISAYEFQKIFEKAGLPVGLLKVVNAEITVVEKLLTSSLFAYVNFIGSAKVGWSLRQKIAPGVRIGLEHGGQAPAVVTEDANIEMAAKALVKGAFYHAGQVCISTQRIFVHKNQLEDFKKKFVAFTNELHVGDARDEKTDVGPLIRSTEIDRIQSWVQEAVQEGTTILTGNKTSGDGRFLSPTILLNADRNSKVMKEEIFGPVVCLNSYENLEELLVYLNENPYIFESCLFSQDEDKCQLFAEEMNSMTVVVNNHNAYRVDWMPFGGHGLSGLGMGGVKYLIEEMTRLKQVITKIS